MDPGFIKRLKQSIREMINSSYKTVESKDLIEHIDLVKRLE